jgi:hypothetical protein
VIISFITGYLASRTTPIYVDEYAYTFLGHFLIQGRLATMTSFLSLYQSLHYVGPTVQLPWGQLGTGEPWLDHPPLVSMILIPFLLADLPARTLPILLSSLDGAMIYILLRRRKLLALISVALLIVYVATNPILSMLFLETGVTFFAMVTLVLTSEYLNGKKQQAYLYFAALSAGLAAASKESGLSVVLYFGLFLLYLKWKDKKSIVSSLKPFLLSLSISLTWFIFALLLAPNLFLQLLKINTNRYQLAGGSTLFHNIPLFFVDQPNLSSPHNIQYGPISPLMVLGVVGVAYLAARCFFTQDLLPVALLPFCYLAFILPTEVFFYTTIVMFPFYSIGIGAILYDLITKMDKSMRRQVQSIPPAYQV